MECSLEPEACKSHAWAAASKPEACKAPTQALPITSTPSCTAQVLLCSGALGSCPCPQPDTPAANDQCCVQEPPAPSWACASAATAQPRCPSSSSRVASWRWAGPGGKPPWISSRRGGLLGLASCTHPGPVATALLPASVCARRRANPSALCRLPCACRVQRIGVERALQAAMGAYVVRLLAYLVSGRAAVQPGCSPRKALVLLGPRVHLLATVAPAVVPLPPTLGGCSGCRRC